MEPLLCEVLSWVFEKIESLSLSLLIRNANKGEFRGRKDTCIYMTESLRYPPETITTLIISCSPIQNKKLKKKAFPVPVLRKQEWKPEREDSVFRNCSV